MEAEKSLASSAELIIGGHGGVAKADAVKLKISNLKIMKKLFSESKSAPDFIEAMEKAYSCLPGESGLEKYGESTLCKRESKGNRRLLVYRRFAVVYAILSKS